jgi:4-diphosphocytidyl-2-C-methyl-D-erythritol kinase
MIAFSSCKINLGLHIINKREDGFHNIETIFYPFEWNDVIEILPSEKLEIEIIGRAIDGEIQNNFCIKAYYLLKKDFDLNPVKFIVLKNIPLGAGLGGGSSNAANTLKLLNQYFKLNLSNDQLKKYASSIGSDCSFFIDSLPSYATGRGEILEPIDVKIDANYLAVIFPAVHVNTAWAYQTFSKEKLYSQSKDLKKIISSPISTWKAELTNDFEKVVFPSHPGIEAIKHKLYSEGSLYASMSGSGSSLFAFFEKEPDKKILSSQLSVNENNLHITAIKQ